MTRIVTSRTAIIGIMAIAVLSARSVEAASPGEQAIAEAAQNNKFTYIMFYKSNDAASKQMHGTLMNALSQRTDATIVSIDTGNRQEEGLIRQFDASRLPMPAVAVLAPNGAVCSVIPRQINEQQVLACIISPVQATCLKSLQENKLVALCVLPNPQAKIPQGVANFKGDKHYAERTRVIPVLAGDQKEAKFLKQLQIPTDKSTPVVAFIAPPGVMVGMFDEHVTAIELAENLAASGKCCEDENCKHNQTAGSGAPKRR
ncbi:MAG: hypothetical protein CMJ46_11165 [Planctomyces sp.]|nr:hypothetical protein [Planctomyces sp.]